MNQFFKQNFPFINKKLAVFLILYILLALILLTITLYHIVVDRVFFIYPLLAVLIGTGVGIFISRMNKISWDHGARHVISEFDIVGVLILVLYILFELYQEEIIGYFVQGPALFATSFALFAGIMIGRILGIRNRIVQTLSENI